MGCVENSPFITRILENFDSPPRGVETLWLDEEGLSKALFRDCVLSSKVPLLVKRGLAPERLKKWNAENLTAHLARQPGKVWATRGVADQGSSHFEEVRVRDYARYLFDDDAKRSEAEPIYVSISKEFMQMLPDMATELGLDRLIPPLYSQYPYAFLGPEDTVSGLHMDDYHSLFTQVWGNKIFVLIPPTDTPNVYVSQKYDWASKLSRVDLRQVEANRRDFPSIRGCTPFVAEVSTGDLLWTPSGWFHFVYATTPTFSVTFFLASPWRWATFGIWEDWFKVGLHRLGLLGRRHGCTCHEGDG